jgi:Kef-type K+ transport system membrane component KefB
MIEAIQQTLWHIGGFILTISLFLFILTFIWSYIFNRLIGWHKKEQREIFLYFIKNKDKIKQIIEGEKNGKQK